LRGAFFATRQSHQNSDIAKVITGDRNEIASLRSQRRQKKNIGQVASNRISLWMEFLMKEKDRHLIRSLGVLSTVGITLVAATVIGLYIGLKLDGWLGTSPWLTALFLAIGLFAGFRNLFIYVKKSEEGDDDSDKRDQK
jgi:ATP synthase protein I